MKQTLESKMKNVTLLVLEKISKTFDENICIL